MPYTPTARQQLILDYITEHAQEFGSTPTIREIGAAVGISSTSVTNYHLNKLRAAGLLNRTGAVSRGLAIPGAIYVPPGATVIGVDDDGREVAVRFVALASVAA